VLEEQHKTKRKEETMQSLRVIISGGGTGGHVFPAIAIANAIKARDKNAQIHFVGANGKLEMTKVPAAGYTIDGLNIAGFQRKLTLKNISFFFKLAQSLLRAKKIIKQFKPDVVIGVGGYASGPVLQVASSRKIPTMIQEQNSFPGITNRLLAKKVKKICVAYEGLERWFPKEKIILTGNPVRQEVVQLEGKKDRGLEQFGLLKGVNTVLVIGGSLGARTINESVLEWLAVCKQSGLQLLWQTGTAFYETAKKAADEVGGESIKVVPFIDRMDLAYAVADIVISRAGAMSLSELCLVCKPAILIPSPNVAEDHQTKNAMALVNHGAALMIADKNAKEELGKVVFDLLNDEETMIKLKTNIAKLGFTNAAEAIASEVFAIAK
jgi:UDP-N-acetylglucosamine--N-acetylmuramyl-(pentapeptide) pyrophosphoryl-undecaprenol N-acetylglucosamine transferase